MLSREMQSGGADPEALDKSQVGTKNANLAHLLQQGYPVPKGFAVPAKRIC
jgi:phosphoenolpyruvate synthase/pyruvate phosphate dikinase